MHSRELGSIEQNSFIFYGNDFEVFVHLVILATY